VEGNSEDDSDLEMLDLEDSEEEASSASDNDEGGVIINEEEDDEEMEEDGEGLFDEEDDDLIGSESEAGSDIDALFEKELQTAAENGDGDGEESGKEETSRQKRRKLKNLPTFASVEDYAEMLENEEDEDLG